MTISWPSANTGFQHQQLSLAPSTSWMGSQIDGRRDASGLLYMRNRYYDPATARFTQEDPIGLAGGLNLYGFAAGDPVTYSDPYGLAPDDENDAPKCDADAEAKEGRLCPVKVTVKAKRRSFRECMQNNRFSSLFDGTRLDGAMEIVEVVSMASFGADMIATGAKGGTHNLGTNNPYASGMNWGFRRFGDVIGDPRLGRKLARKIGDRATPVLAVTGAFMTAYNGTIAAQCGLGVLQ